VKTKSGAELGRNGEVKGRRPEVFSRFHDVKNWVAALRRHAFTDEPPAPREATLGQALGGQGHAPAGIGAR
jgi:hypothetical protein